MNSKTQKNLTNEMLFFAGPCSIENSEQMHLSGSFLNGLGIKWLRGGLFKMRTSAESFQGLGFAGIPLIKEIKEKYKLKFITEITDPRQASDLAEISDMFQVGSRNMYNYALLNELANFNKPVLLKRGFSALYDEWFKAADYITKNKSASVILCERGIRSFESKTRNTLDLNAVAFVKQHTNFKIIVDPSHGTGRPELIEQMSLASIASGADGLIIESHPMPSQALSDGHQALTHKQLKQVYNKANQLFTFMKKLNIED